MKLVASTIRFLFNLQGHSADTIAREFDVPVEYVLKRLRRLKLIESQKEVLKTIRISDRASKPYAEFTKSIKKRAFSIGNGKCKICNQILGDGLHFDHKDINYHHEVPIFRGGLGTLENCIPLHEKCHYDNYKKLHGIALPIQFSKSAG
jgi:5-methylcytosine-specific restriction endonuclease McrA